MNQLENFFFCTPTVCQIPYAVFKNLGCARNKTHTYEYVVKFSHVENYRVLWKQGGELCILSV